MRITRRDFIKWAGASAAAMGVSQANTMKLMEAFANPGADAIAGGGDVPRVVWLQGQNCSGCSTSFLGTVLDLTATPDGSSSKVGEVLVAFRNYWKNGGGYKWTGLATLSTDNDATYSELTGGTASDVLNDHTTATIEDVALDVLDIRMHNTVQAAGGALAMEETNDTASGTGYYGLQSFLPGGANATGSASKPYVLVVEGSIPDDEYCTIGRLNSAELSIKAAVTGAAVSAAAVVACGSCATWGGVPSAQNLRTKGTQYRRTNAAPVSTILQNAGLGGKTVVNIPGCPIQPDVFTLALLGAVYWVGHAKNDSYLLPGIFEGVDSLNRPAPWYSYLMHIGGYAGNTSKGCPRFTDYTAWDYATTRGQSRGCLIGLGCKGPSTHTPCARVGWNNSRTYYRESKHCIQGGHPCYGCMEKGFPDKFEPFLNYE